MRFQIIEKCILVVKMRSRREVSLGYAPHLQSSIGTTSVMLGFMWKISFKRSIVVY